MRPLPLANLFLLIVALFAVIAWIIPEAHSCFIPPNAPTRGFYETCWSYEMIVL